MSSPHEPGIAVDPSKCLHFGLGGYRFRTGCLQHLNARRKGQRLKTVSGLQRSLARLAQPFAP